jgi:putative membrane protein
VVVEALPGYAPYCGSPPSSLTLLSRWNLDPVLVGVLAVALLVYVALAEPAGVARWRRSCFAVGWTIGCAALISPLCALSVALFSARLGQHMILEMVAAPLIALGTPTRPTAIRPSHPLAAAAVFTVTLWFWHAPGPYDATFNGPTVYWLMHLTAFGAALWLWRAVLLAPGARVGTGLTALLLTTLQMGFLGALLTFSARPVYVVHAQTTLPWGLSPLDDQQLGGIIMWIPTGVIFVAAMVGAVALMMQRVEARPLEIARP